MGIECASCDRFACRVGALDALPESCPMRGPFPDFDDLYTSAPVRRLAYAAARVEGEGYGRWSRLREIEEVARRMGWGRLGVAHCRDTRTEADLTARLLRDRGFQVLLPPWTGHCDPVAQAAYLHGQKSDFNIVCGMCVGHDALFVRHSSSPITSFVVRDRRLQHNPVAALYTRKGYLKEALYRPGDAPAATSFRGWSDPLLEQVSREVRDAATSLEPPSCRVQEIIDFARRAGVSHLGLVFCSGFREEARHLAAILGTSGFRVSSSCCKTGSVPKERIGIGDAEKVRPGRPEMLCNPVAQAELLEREAVELVLLMGQCVGHDSATLAHLHTPAVFVVAKDRVLAHNTVAALYAAANGLLAAPRSDARTPR